MQPCFQPEIQPYSIRHNRQQRAYTSPVSGRLDGPAPFRHRKTMAYNAQDILAALLGAAKRAGADAADALFVENVSASVSYRLGKLEDVERSESADLGLRVFLGNRVAFVSS